MEIIKISGILFLVGTMFYWALSYYKGRKILEYMRRRHLTKWEELGKPKPDYLSSINYQKWSMFIKKKYLSIQDEKLNTMCESQWKLEKITLILTIIFFAVFGGIALWYEFAGRL